MQKMHLRKPFVCHSYRHPPPLSPFPATLTKTPGVAYRFFSLLGVGASAPTYSWPGPANTFVLRSCAFRIPVVTGTSCDVCSARAEMLFPTRRTRITDHALAPPTAHKPDISATDTSPATPSLSIACRHSPSPRGVGVQHRTFRLPASRSSLASRSTPTGENSRTGCV